MATDENDDLLIAPEVRVQGLTPPPPPQIPPTKDDVDRALLYKTMVESSLFASKTFGATIEDLNESTAYYVRLRKRYQQSQARADITWTDATREFRQFFEHMEERMTSLEYQMIRHWKTTISLEQMLDAVKDLQAQSLKQQEMNASCELSEGNRRRTAVPSAYGILPSSKETEALRFNSSSTHSYKGLQSSKSVMGSGRLNSNEARDFVLMLAVALFFFLVARNKTESVLTH
ncbi:uncharacterized protein V1513DRAFT_225033 [Lipomyces chichibuensis]|uniref:uncharacterized protein n=1 Tax=Lipomyces chichibuensis TaxID=1546026 RepID=UPI00334387EC